jgi:lipopolysaccharide/colanic/teichoic acid biosynthesis glycosyltransferase
MSAASDQPPVFTPMDLPAVVVPIRSAARRRRPSRLGLQVFSADLLVLIGTYLLLVLFFDQVAVDAVHLVEWCAALVVTWVFVASGRAYSPGILHEPLQSAYVGGKLTLITGALFYLVPLIGGGGNSRFSNLTVVLAVALAMACWRALLAVFAPPAREDLVVVGAGWAGQALAEALADSPECGMHIVAFVDADERFAGRLIHGARVHRIEELTDLVRRPQGLARVVLANAGHAHTAVFDQLTTLGEANIEIVQMSTLYEQVTGRIPVRHLGNYWWAVLPRPSSDTVYWLGKRTTDILLSVLGLACLAVLLPLLWPILRHQTGGSLFFSQQRIGKHGRPFTVHKLRTLPVAPAGQQLDWRARKAANNPTPLCVRVRALGLDEVPQLLNVLRGDMSLIGPRPYVPQEVEAFQRQIPFFRSRGLVRPGVTGWAQTNYGYGMSIDDEVEKLQHDLYYIGHQSTYLDMLILARTALVAFRGRRPRSRVSLSALPKLALYALSGASLSDKPA